MTQKYSIIDIETTGSRNHQHKITEIAIINMDGREVVESFSTLINPQRNISYRISALTGITNDMVEDAPKFYEVAKKIVQMTEGRIFVAHNVYFDYNFIKQEFSDLGYQYKRKKMCSVKMARKAFPGKESYSLGKICQELGIEIKNRHRAMGDAKATAELFKLILKKPFQMEEHLVKESKVLVPPKLKTDDYESLPEKTGIYYFYDDSGNTLYVGKSKNIKKRVAQHFRLEMKRNKDIKLRKSIAKVAYEILGDELAALFLENHEIKVKRPYFNVSLKRNKFPYAVKIFKEKEVYRLKVVSVHNISPEEVAFYFHSKKSASAWIHRFYQSLFGSTLENELELRTHLEKYLKTIGREHYNNLIYKQYNKSLPVEDDFILQRKLSAGKRILVRVEKKCPKEIILHQTDEIKRWALRDDPDMRKIFWNSLVKKKALYEKITDPKKLSLELE